jgi:hypothetical protein
MAVLEKAGAQTLIIMMTNLKYVNALGHFLKTMTRRTFKTKISLLHLGSEIHSYTYCILTVQVPFADLACLNGLASFKKGKSQNA